MLFYENALWLLVVALLLDALVGDPDWLWRRLPHPIVLIGKVISYLDRKHNSQTASPVIRKRNGVLVLILLAGGALGLGLALQALFSALPLGDILTVVIAAIFIAQRSLSDHVSAVRNGLRDGGLEAGRQAVSMIVGRDPNQLDEAGVSRAAIESCSENFSDGIVAPAFWFAVLGLPGLLAYKAINTADSMIGHKTEKYGAFGWASARFDDLVNLPASRLSGLFIALAAPMASGSSRRSLKCIFNDARKHRSPNAGWPEAAMAGALDLALAGPRIYPGYSVNDPYLNEGGRKDANADDISRALVVVWGAWGVMTIAASILAAVL